MSARRPEGSPASDPRQDEPAVPEPSPPDGPGLPAHELWARMAPYERLYRQRTVFLRGPIKDTVADDLIAALLALEADGDEDVTMVIDCPGGDTYGMFAIHDAVQSLRPRVHTRALGMAASAGGFLLATGTGTRSATVNARILLHQPWGGIPRSTAVDLRTQAEQFRVTRHRMEELLAERTGKSPEQIHRDIDRDLWLSAEQARAYGVVDEVVAPRARSA